MKKFNNIPITIKIDDFETLSLADEAYLTEEERRLVAMRLSKTCWKIIIREFKCHRSTAYYRYQKALCKIFCFKSPIDK